MSNKFLKFFKNLATFFVIVTLSFSNIPFNVLTGAIDGYVKTSNIVDQAWSLSHDDNVVDNLVSSYRNKNIALLDKLAGNLKIKEAHAAISYVGGVTCSRAGSTGTALTCSLTALTGGSNTSPSPDDLVIAVVSTGSTADRAIGVTNVGYTELPELYANATNDTNLSVSWKIMGATPDTAVNFSASGSTADAISAVVHVWRGIDTVTPFDVTNQSITGTATGRPNPPPITPVTSGATVIAIGAGAAGTGAVYVAAGLANFRTVTSVDTYDSMTGMGSFAWTSGAYDSAQWTGGTANAADSWASYTLALRPMLNVAPTLTVSQPDGTGDTVTVGDLYNITYDLADPEQAVTVAMHYDVDAVGLDGNPISGACVTGAEGTGVTCSWDTTGMTPGTYYVYGVTDDGIAAPVSDYSPGVITINAPATLTIGATAGSKATTLNSGATSQYANTTACNSTATCSAFTILSSSGETLNSIKITETGTTNASNNLSNLALFYDTDGNYSNGVTGQYGSTVATYTTETATVSGTLALVAGTTYYFYVRTDLINGANDPVGGETINFQIAANADVTTSLASTKSGAPVSLAGTTTVKPNATAVTYQVNSDGGRSGYSATVTGNGFGVAPVGSRGSCSGAVNTGCVQFIVGGTATVATGDVSAWANRSLSFTVNSALASNGGASAIEVSSGAQTDTTPLTFYIYPTLSSVTNCDKAGFPPGAYGREYDATDAACPNTLTDGAIIITGDHFGVAGTVTILGGTATQSAVAAFCGGSAYTSTCSALRVPTALAGNTGSIVLTRTSDSKTDTFASFRVLPRITSNTATTEISGNKIKILGNHFCQSGTCPVSPNRSTANDNVVFGTTQALESDFVNSGTAPCSGNVQAWTETEICVKVPAGLTTGSQATKVTSNTSYLSNTMAFTVPSTIPNDPVLTVPKQYKSDGTTVITHMTKTNETTVVLKADISGSIAIDMALQVEVDSTGAGFDGAGIVQGTVGGGGACTACTSLSNARVTVTGLSDGDKQWRARVINTGNGTELSNWVYYVNPSTAEVDFTVDTTAPVISGPSSSGPPSPGTNTATITWTTDEQSTSQVQYQAVLQASCTAYSFASSCGTNNDCTTINTTPVYSPHTTELSNLNSGTDYCYRVRSKDASGNERIDTNNYSFQTLGNLNPAKTTKSYINGATGLVIGATPYYFTVNIPELTPSVKSAYVEVLAVALNTGSVSINVNGVGARSYAVNATAPTLYRFLYKINLPNTETNLNLNDVTPCTNDNTPGIAPETAPCNTLTITPTTTNLYVLSGEIITNYAYTP